MSLPRIPPPSVDLSQLVRERVTALHPSTFVMRRRALDDMGLVDEQIPGSYGEDYDWLLRAARRRPIVAVEQPLVEVYWHRQSFFAERWEAIVDALAYLLGKHPELRADRRGLARIQGQIAFAQAALARRSAACEVELACLAQQPARASCLPGSGGSLRRRSGRVYRPVGEPARPRNLSQRDTREPS